MSNLSEHKAQRHLFSSETCRFPVNVRALLATKNDITIGPFAEWKDFIELHNLHNAVANRDALSFFDGDRYYIWYGDGLPDNMHNYAIAHEFGHIEMGHLSTSSSTASDLQEWEADEFARELIAPTIVLRAIGVKAVPDIVSLTNLPTNIAAIVATDVHCQQSQTDISKGLIRQMARPTRPYKKRVAKRLLSLLCAVLIVAFACIAVYCVQINTVYTTKAGTKYHTADCHVVHDQQVSRHWVQDAITMGYEPCTMCFKDK